MDLHTVISIPRKQNELVHERVRLHELLNRTPFLKNVALQQFSGSKT